MGHREAQGSRFGFNGFTTNLGCYLDLFRNASKTAAAKVAAPQSCEANFQATIWELGQEEAARRFVANHHFSSGPGDTFTPFPLPELPVSFLSMPMG